MATDALKDPRLSIKSKGVLAYIMSKPGSWKTRVTDLRRNSTDGIHSIRAAFRELRHCGYAELKFVRSEDGKHNTGKEMTVTDRPTFKPESQKTRKSGNLKVRKPDYQEIGSLSNKEGLEKKTGRVGPAANVSRRGLLPLPEPTVKFSKAVKEFSRFSRNRDFHLSPFTKVGFKPGADKNGWTRSTLLQWQEIWETLKKRVPPALILDMVIWYSKNHGRDFVPEAQTFRSFAEKFYKIQEARKRIERDKAREKEQAGETDEADVKEILRDMSPEERRRYDALPTISPKKK